MRYLTPLILSLLLTMAAFASDGAGKQVVVLAYGDSLTAGYGLGPSDGFTPQLQAWLAERLTHPVKVVNAGVSGDTSSGARARLEWTVAGLPNGKADLVILELGGNDVLRGIDPKITLTNMSAMINFFQSKGMQVLIAGMRSPPSYGPEYQGAFDALYPDLARQHQAKLYPFFLEGVAMDKNLNQADGIHPTKEGIAIIVEKIGPLVESMLKQK